MAELTANLNVREEVLAIVEKKIAARQAEIDTLKRERDEARAEIKRMAEVAMTWGSHTEICMSNYSADCNCGFWRDLGLLG